MTTQTLQARHIRLHWLDQQHTALHLRFDPAWTWDDFYIVHKTAFARMSITQNAVDLVYSFREPRPLPKRYHTHLLRISERYPNNLGLVIWVGCDRLNQKLIRNLTTQHPVLAGYYVFLDTLEQARLVVGS